MALDLWFDLILTCTAKLSFCILVQWLAHRLLYSVVVREVPRDFTEYARLCKDVLRLYFWNMVAAMVPESRDEAFAADHFREDELGESDSEEELDNEVDYEEEYGEEEFSDWEDYVAPVGMEGYYGEQSYDNEELSSEGRMGWEEGDGDEDAVVR